MNHNLIQWSISSLYTTKGSGFQFLFLIPIENQFSTGLIISAKC